MTGKTALLLLLMLISLFAVLGNATIQDDSAAGGSGGSSGSGDAAGSCNDQEMNGNEEGIDCGGRCATVCPTIINVLDDFLEGRMGLNLLVRWIEITRSQVYPPRVGQLALPDVPSFT